jgi:hypothetical protein
MFFLIRNIYYQEIKILNVKGNLPIGTENTINIEMMFSEIIN